MANKATGVPNIFPSFRYEDAPGAIEWLNKAFGFEKQCGPGREQYRSPRPAPPRCRHDHDGVRRQAGPRESWATERYGIYVVVADIDVHYARAKAAGAKIERPLADTEYGSREYSARDCDGHLWSFGTYDPYAGS